LINVRHRALICAVKALGIAGSAILCRMRLEKMLFEKSGALQMRVEQAT